MSTLFVLRWANNVHLHERVKAQTFDATQESWLEDRTFHLEGYVFPALRAPVDNLDSRGIKVDRGPYVIPQVFLEKCTDNPSTLRERQLMSVATPPRVLTHRTVTARAGRTDPQLSASNRLGASCIMFLGPLSDHAFVTATSNATGNRINLVLTHPYRRSLLCLLYIDTKFSSAMWKARLSSINALEKSPST